MTIKKLTILFLAILIIAPLTAVHAIDKPVDSIVFTNYKMEEPFYFLDSSGKARGILVDYWRSFGKVNNLQISFLENNNNTDIDVKGSSDSPKKVKSWLKKAQAIAGVSYVPHTQKNIVLSEPFMELSLKLYALHDIAIKSPGDPKEVEIAIVDDEKTVKILKGLYNKADFKLFKSYGKLFESVYKGQSKAFISDKNTALYYLNRTNILDKYKEVKSAAYIEIRAAVKKSNLPLLATINDGIQRVEKKDIKNIFKSWVGTNTHSGQSQSSVQALQIIVASTAFLLIISLLLLFRKMIQYKNIKLKLADKMEVLQNEEALRKLAESSYQNIVDNSLTGFFIIHDKRFKYVNSRFLSTLGYDEYDEVMALSSYTSIFSEINIDEIEKVLFEEQQDKNRPLWVDCVAIRKDGRPITIETLWFKYSLDGQNATMGSLSDITDYSTTDGQIKAALKEKVSVLRELKEKNQELDELRQDFDSKIKKETRTQLANHGFTIYQLNMSSMVKTIEFIFGRWSQSLQDIGLTCKLVNDTFEAGQLDSATMKDAFNKTMENVSSITNNVEPVLDVLKPSTKKGHFDLIGAIKEAVSVIIYNLEREKIEVSYKFNGCDEKAPLVINGYASEFKQTQLIILHNCIEAIALRRSNDDDFNEAGNITIEISCEDENIKVLVKDNGIPVPPNVLSKVFDHSFKTTERKRITQSLYILKMIIEDNMGGYLTIFNEDNVTVFSIELKQR